MLLGLPIDGNVVNGRVNQDNSICEEFLGAPLYEDTTMGHTSAQPRGQGINLKYLKQYYSSITLNE